MDSDLLTKLGSKMTASKVKVDETTTTVGGAGATSDSLTAGEVLTVPGKVPLAASVVKSEQSVTDTTAQTTVDDSTTDPDSWTKDSALKEIKKLRQENKATRLKYQEKVDELKGETDKRLSSLEEQYKTALEAKKELETIKANEQDKKRNLEEKLAHRETMLQSIQKKMEDTNKEYETKLQNLSSEVGKYRAEREAEHQVYQSRVQEELGKIPADYREFASSMVKGYGDPREALLALNEANLKGMFKDKTVVVNHSVPGAADGARSSQAKLDAAAQESRAKMKGSDLIKEGLKAIRDGKPNSAFPNLASKAR